MLSSSQQIIIGKSSPEVKGGKNDGHLKSDDNKKQCELKSLNTNDNILSRIEKEIEEEFTKNNQIVSPNKYDEDYVKDRNTAFGIEQINLSRNSLDIHDIYYIYNEETEISDLIIKRYKENHYLTIFNNMLIIINPNKNVKDFYKLLFKNKNKNNYIFKLFMNNIKEKSIEEKYENDNINLQESSDSSDNSYRNEHKNISYLNKKELMNFEMLKRMEEKGRKYISTIRKNLFINSNNEITDIHSDTLKNFATLFNIRLEINRGKSKTSNSDSINSDIDENYINYIEKKKKWDNPNMGNTQNDNRRSNSTTSKQINYEQFKNMHNNKKMEILECKNKFLFIHGEKYSNQYVVNNYILKHIIKDENNKELYYSYKNIMSILNLFFVNKCFNFIIYKCANNKIIYFNIVPCFLSEQNNNVTNICTKINEFFNQLIDSEKKTNNQKRIAKQMKTKGKVKNNHNNEITHSTSGRESNENETSTDNKNIKDEVIDLRKLINIPHIFFFLLKCVLNNNHHRFFKDLKLHTLDIKKICRNYIDIPYTKLNSFDADKLFSSFLKIGFSEEDIININKIIFAILFINIYISIRNCLILNEQKALNQLQIQLIQVHDYIKLRKLHLNNNESTGGKNTQFNLNKFLNFNYKSYVNSEQSSHPEYDNNISKKKNSEKKIKSNYFIVFVGHILEEYISYLLNIDLCDFLDILNDKIKLTNFCSTVYFRLKLKIIKQVNQYLNNRHSTERKINHIWYIYSNSGVMHNFMDQNYNKKNVNNNNNNEIEKYQHVCNENKQSSLSSLINNIYNEIIYSYYIKISAFNLDICTIHTIKNIRNKNKSYEDATVDSINKCKRINDKLENRNLNNSYIYKCKKNVILYLLEKYTRKILAIIEEDMSQDNLNINNNILTKPEYFKLIYNFHLSIKKIMQHYWGIMDKLKNIKNIYNKISGSINEQSDDQKGIDNEKSRGNNTRQKYYSEHYIKKVINKVIKDINKMEELNHKKYNENIIKNAKKCNFSIVHYNNDNIKYKCNNILLDNFKDLCPLNNTIDIIENTKMDFLKKLFLDNSVSLKYFKSNLMHNEISFFLYIIKNCYERFYIYLINEREKNKTDNSITFSKYIDKNKNLYPQFSMPNENELSSSNDSIINNDDIQNRSNENIDGKDSDLQDDLIVNKSYKKYPKKEKTDQVRKKMESYLSFISYKQINDFSELKKQLNKKHIESIVKILHLKTIFKYQMKYLYYNISYMDFINKYLRFCVHINTDGSLARLVNSYEKKFEKTKESYERYLPDGPSLNTIGTRVNEGSSKKWKETKIKKIYNSTSNTQNSEEHTQNYYKLENIPNKDKKNLCKIIVHCLNLAKEDVYYYNNFVFIKKRYYFILEHIRNEFVRTILPSTKKNEDMYITYKDKKMKNFYTNKVVKIQSYIRKFLNTSKMNKIEKQKNLLVSFLIFYSYIVKNRNKGETREDLELYKQKFMKEEKELIRYAASVYIQSWYRKIIQQRKFKALKIELYKKKAMECIYNTIKTYIVQIKTIAHINDVIIPNKCALLIQSNFRKHICFTDFRKKLLLKICFLSIKRKYLTYSNIITKVNYHHLAKNIYNRNNIQSLLKIPEAVIKIQSKYKAYVVRKQYKMLRDAIYFTQAYMHTCLETIKYNNIKNSVILIQRWWRSFCKLKKVFSNVQLNIYSNEYDKRKYYFLNKDNFPFYNYYTLKEQKAMKLLTYNILLKQWYFFYFKKFQKKNHIFNIVFNLKLYKNISYHYTLPWAYKINTILKIIYMKQMFQKCTNNSQNTIFNIPVFESIQIFVGRTHTILLIKQTASNEPIPWNVNKRNSKNYYHTFVYSIGSNEFGQLGYYNLFEKNFIYNINNTQNELVSMDNDEENMNEEESPEFDDTNKYDSILDDDNIGNNLEKNQTEKKNLENGDNISKDNIILKNRVDSTITNSNDTIDKNYKKEKRLDDESSSKEYILYDTERNKKTKINSLCNKYKQNLQHLIFEYKDKYIIGTENFYKNQEDKSINDIVDYKIVEKENEKTGEIEKVVQFTKIISETNKIINICCGSEHTLALSENRNVYAWGNNTYGQCGHKYELNVIRYPKIIKYFKKNNIHIKNISCASYHSGYITETSDLYISGNFFFINLKYYNQNLYEPTFLISDCHNILCRDNFNISLRTNKNSLYLWGNNYKCTLGINKEKLSNLDEISCYPLSIISKTIAVQKIVCSENFVCLITKYKTAEYSLYMWGEFTLIEKKTENDMSSIKNNTMSIFDKYKIKPIQRNTDEQNKKKQIKNKKILIAKPSPVYNDIWDSLDAIDICCDLNEVLVLMSNLGLYGFSSVEIFGDESEQTQTNEPKFSFRFPNKKVDEKSEKSYNYEEPKIYEKIKLLNPSLYMFKYFKPSYFNIKKINCSYNKNSLSIINATMGQYDIQQIKKKMDYITPSGDIAQFPKKIQEKMLEMEKRESNKWIKSTDDPYINHFLVNSSDSDSNF
ncbi:conserved Plasmodium protein, unknown function [Plasmodium chabaudi adami]|uniref:Cell cycle associated protein n=1 Tax=Plasmodium chabaudi adami TaxID=5826 RepID=A0A1D3S3T6_PLACE|nr:conserved Plasmodium protein, unknown function [Plasmodium chabaudi adami]